MRHLPILPIALALALTISIAVAEQPGESEDEPDYWSFHRTGTAEDSLHLDMPVGDHICRFESWYDPPEESWPYRYFEAKAWLFDEEHDYVVSFDIDRGRDVKTVSIRQVTEQGGTADAEQVNTWNRYVRDAETFLLDTSPRLEISLSRGFRHREFRWAFTCTEIRWPAAWSDGGGS